MLRNGIVLRIIFDYNLKTMAKSTDIQKALILILSVALLLSLILRP